MMEKDKDKPQPHDSTAAMASAWFGTPGCGDAIDRVFGDRSSKTGTEVKVKAAKPSPLFCVPHFDYTIDLRSIRGVTSTFSGPDLKNWRESDTEQYTLHNFYVDLTHQANALEFSRTDRYDSEIPVKGMTQVHEARSALIQAWKDYTEATS